MLAKRRLNAFLLRNAFENKKPVNRVQELLKFYWKVILYVRYPLVGSGEPLEPKWYHICVCQKRNIRWEITWSFCTVSPWKAYEKRKQRERNRKGGRKRTSYSFWEKRFQETQEMQPTYCLACWRRWFLILETGLRRSNLDLEMSLESNCCTDSTRSTHHRDQYKYSMQTSMREAWG